MKRIHLSIIAIAAFASGTALGNPRITAEQINAVVNDVAIAEGNAIFNDGVVTIRASRLEYSAKLKQVRCVGPGVAEINGITVVLNDGNFDLATKVIVPTGTSEKPPK